MPLDVEHVEEICLDVKNQYEQGVCDCLSNAACGRYRSGSYYGAFCSLRKQKVSIKRSFCGACKRFS